MLDFLTGNIPAENFQSIAQLTVAVSLAFVVAGPEVGRLLRNKINQLLKLRATLVTLGKAANVASFPDRLALINSAKDYIEADAERTAPANADTMRFYGACAAASFLVLAYCTIFQEMPVSIAIALTVAAGIVLLRDVWVASQRAFKLEAFADEVRRIAQTLHVLPGTSNTGAAAAGGIISELQLETITLDEAIDRLRRV